MERPASTAEVRDLIASADRIEVIGSGAKRSLGPVQACDVTLSTQAMNQVVDYAPDELVLTAQAGTPLAQIEALLAEQGQMLAFEPPSLARLLGVEGSPTLGGAIAANLSGPRRLRAGAARDHLLGFEAVSGRGEVFKAGGKVVKNVTGYDLCKLMAGSWGTLAVLTEITVKVLPAPRTERTLLFFGLSEPRAADALGKAMASPCEVSGAAHVPTFAAQRPPLEAEMAVTALRIEGFEASVAERVTALVRLLQGCGAVQQLGQAHSIEFWAQLREVEALADDPRPLWRLSVPPAAGLEAMAEAPGDALFDWAGGLVWLLSEARPERVRAAAARLGGHATQYRGEGPTFQPITGPLASLNARVKAAFDPMNKLNPGRFAEVA